jgi:hypothetical protein
MAGHAAEPTVKADALNRAWRTLYTGIILDALVLIGTGLTSLLTEHDITSEAFWITFGILIGKSFLTSLGSFLLRLKVTPKVEPVTT